MYRFLLTRQWVILTVIALVLMPTMVELGFWQLHRHQDRVAHNERVAASLAADPVPVEELSGPGQRVPEEDTYRPVTATGVYDSAREVVVRRRTAEDGREIGYFVLTPLVRPAGPVLLVNRGWVPPGPDQVSFPEVPPAPDGEVTVTGRLRPDETTGSTGIKDRGGLPDRQVMLISSEQQEDLQGRAVLSGYIELTATEPEPEASHLAEQIGDPDHDGIGAHMAYAVQWWLFVAAVPVGWVILVRREVRDRRAAAAMAPAGGSPALAPAAPGTAD